MNRTRMLVASAALFALALWMFTPEAAAQAEERGWTVVQGGATVDYPQPAWKADYSPHGVTLTNSRTSVVETYYGTFRVIERQK